MRRLLHEKSAATFSTVDLLRNTFHRGTVEDRYAGVSSADVIIKFVSARLIGLSGRICFLPVFCFFYRCATSTASKSTVELSENIRTL